MSDELTPIKKRDYVNLTELSTKKIEKWFEQIVERKVEISRKDFVNWILEKMPDNLSNSDLNAIVKRFYDKEAHLRRLLKEIKKAKQEGQIDSIEVIVRQRKADAKLEPEEEAKEVEK